MRRRKKEQKQPEPARYYDCRWYSHCLDDAAKRNAAVMKCDGCIRYHRRDDDSVV